MRTEQARLVRMSLMCENPHDVYGRRLPPGSLSGLELIEFHLISIQQRLGADFKEIAADVEAALVTTRSLIGLDRRPL